MKTRPILMNGEMVRAVLAGRKTQTRRIVKAKDPDSSRCIALPTLMQNVAEWREQNGRWFGIDGYDTLVFCDCPYGRVGDRLYVRENFARSRNNWIYQASSVVVDGPQGNVPEWDWDDSAPNRWRPSIHMPKWASRITLEITDVRVERLIDISDADAIAEGIERTSNGLYFRDYTHETMNVVLPIYSFMTLWQSISGPESWVANPWVWAVTFKRIEASK